MKFDALPVRVTHAGVILTATGSAGVDDVWMSLVCPGSWSRWAPHIRRVEYAHRRLLAGTSGRVLGPPPVSIGFSVLDVDEAARAWTWRVALRPLGIVMSHQAIPMPGGTRVRLVIKGFHALALGYAPLALWALRRLASTAPAPPPASSLDPTRRWADDEPRSPGELA